MRGLEPPVDCLQGSCIAIMLHQHENEPHYRKRGFEPHSLEELTDSFLLAASLYSVFKHLPPTPFRSARLSETGWDLLCLGGTEIRVSANGIDWT